MTISRSHRWYRRRSQRQHAPWLPNDYQLRFASLYTYSPTGDSAASARSRRLCSRVKSGAASWLKSYTARVLSEAARGGRLNGFFQPGCVLVPVPMCDASAPDSCWSARRLAGILRDAGVAEDVWIGLRRANSVERSAGAWPWERPTVWMHYQSFFTVPVVSAPSEIVLVDDVVTKGRTLIAAAMRMSGLLPGATIRGFALIRTMGLVDNLERVFDPCTGDIWWDGKDAFRKP